jgi:hypothetical protein
LKDQKLLKIFFRFPYIFVSKEIIQAHDANSFSWTQKEKHLQLALSSPTGKISSLNRYFPSGRYIEDFIFQKMFNKLDVIGFTINPEFCSGFKYIGINLI